METFSKKMHDWEKRRTLEDGPLRREHFFKLILKPILQIVHYLGGSQALNTTTNLGITQYL